MGPLNLGLMKRSVLMLIVMSATVILPAKSSWACSCVQSTPKEHAARADVIFTGTATDPDLQEGVYWTSFDVEILYKGTLGPTAAVETVGDAAGSCGIVFKEGQRYTVFARAQEDGLDTNICMGTTDQPIDYGSYSLAPRPISSGETRFAPEPKTDWFLWLGLIGGALVLYGLGFAILERRRARKPKPVSPD
jgi:hypothetical protein